jgi:GxxExxY protein
MSASDTEQPDAKVAKATQKSQNERPLADDCSREIIGCSVEVQRVLGIGLLENAYSAALAVELAERGLRFQREVPVSARYKGRDIGVAYRADFIVEDSVVVELKATEGAADAHRAQLLTYLKLSGLRIGLLINFNTFPVTKGIHRVVNKL